MALLLLFHNDLGGGGLLEIITFIFAFVFASVYYMVPSFIFGKAYFLMETVISPLGMAGLLLSAGFWLVIVGLTVAVIHLLVLWVNRGKI